MAGHNDIERFLAKVREVESGCHEWQGTLHRTGYGKFWFAGRTGYAHRAAYSLFVGDPGELRVLHRCDNRRCVNTEHLFLGTDRDNVRDMHAKGRAVGRRKVSDELALRILALLATDRSQQSIADEVGISQITVSRIKLGQRVYLTRIQKGI